MEGVNTNVGDFMTEMFKLADAGDYIESLDNFFDAFIGSEDCAAVDGLQRSALYLNYKTMRGLFEQVAKAS